MNTASHSTAAGAESLEVALVRLWHAIQVHHVEVPDVEFAIGAGDRGRGLVDYGHYTSGKWVRRDETGGEHHIGEVTIAAEILDKGPDALLATVLHVSAHALAEVRGIGDTSRQGRYHNALFRDLASEVGLDVKQHGSYGWCRTTAPADTVHRYQPQHDALAAALTAHTWIPDTPAQASRWLVSRCKCTPPRPMRMSRTTFEAGDVICGTCKATFVLDEDNRATTPPAGQLNQQSSSTDKNN